MVKTTLQVLKEARELIAKGFAHDSYAKGPNGFEVDAMSDDATCFCTLGAIARAEGFNTGNDTWARDMYLDSAAVREITHTLIDLGHGDGQPVEREEYRAVVVPAYNDQATREQVLQIFDITIKRLENV